MEIQFTERAVEEACRLQSTAYPGQNLRVYLEGKGCDGFYYGISFVDETGEAQDLTWALSQDPSLLVHVDKDSLAYLTGSTIDWVDDDRGQGFMVDNPKHDSYKGKFYKRPEFLKKMELSN